MIAFKKGNDLRVNIISISFSKEMKRLIAIILLEKPLP